MFENGYIKLHRSIVNWEWWHNRNTRDLFIYLLLAANIKDSQFEGNVIKRGSLVSTIQRLSAESGLTVQEVKTALKHLKSTNELTTKTTSKYSIITINNYKKFQEVTNEVTNDQKTDEVTNDQKTDKKQVTNDQPYNKKNKEYKEEKEEYIYNMSTNVDGREQFDYQKVADLFNSICVSLPKVTRLTEKRKKQIKNANKQLNGDFENFFKQIEKSDFLTGRSGSWTGCCFDWVLKSSNLIKIIEGNYVNRSDENGNAEKPDNKQNFECKLGDWL